MSVSPQMLAALAARNKMLADYAEQSAALTAAYEAACNAPPTAEDLAWSENRQAEVAAEQAAKAAVAADNAAAIALLEKLLPLTVEQVESLPHRHGEYVDCVVTYGAIVKTYFAHRNPYSDHQSKIDWVAVVKTGELTLAMVQGL